MLSGLQGIAVRHAFFVFRRQVDHQEQTRPVPSVKAPVYQNSTTGVRAGVQGGTYVSRQ